MVHAETTEEEGGSIRIPKSGVDGVLEDGIVDVHQLEVHDTLWLSAGELDDTGSSMYEYIDTERQPCLSAG